MAIFFFTVYLYSMDTTKVMVDIKRGPYGYELGPDGYAPREGTRLD